MKLKATTEKIKIEWFAVLHDGSMMRNSAGFQHNAWDVKCSCGWETRTGGAIRSCIQTEVYKHKRFDHNYSLAVTK